MIGCVDGLVPGFIGIVLLSVSVSGQSQVSVLDNTSEVLICDHGSADLASFLWRKGSTVLLQGFISGGQPTVVVDSAPDKTELQLQGNNPNMLLANIAIDDEGLYTCEATPSSGVQAQVTVDIVVRVQPQAPSILVNTNKEDVVLSMVPVDTIVTFTCTSTGGRPPATLTWRGAPVSVNPAYTSSNNSQGLGDATSTLNFTTTAYGLKYDVECTASGPDPIQPLSSTTSITTEPAKDGGGLSGGAIAAIVIVPIVVLTAVGLLVYFLVIKPGGSGCQREVETDGDDVEDGNE